MPAPPSAPGPHEEDRNPKDVDVVEETPLAAIRHSLDPTGGAEHSPGVRLHVQAQAGR